MSITSLQEQLQFQGHLIQNKHHLINKYISEEPVLIKEFLLNYKEGVLTAPLGSGKTYFLIELLLKENIPFVFSAPLRIIAEQNIMKFIARYDHRIALIMSKSYPGQYNYKLKQLNTVKKINDFYGSGDNKSFIIVYDSLKKLSKSRVPLKDYRLIVDEAHMLISEIGYREKAIRKIVDHIPNFKSTLYLSASLETLYYFEKYNTLSLEYKNKVLTNNRIELISKEELGEFPIKTLVNILLALSDKKIVIYINNINSMRRIKNVLLRKGFSEDSVQILHSKTKDSATYLDLVKTERLTENAKVILASDLIATGANIMNDDIDYCIIYDVKNMINKRQFIGRFRKGVRKKILIISDYTYQEESIFSFREKYLSKEDSYIKQNPTTTKENIIQANSYIQENSKILSEINEKIACLPDNEKIYLDSTTTSADVVISNLDEIQSLFDENSIKTKKEFNDLAKSFWTENDYFWDHFNSLLIYYLKYKSKYLLDVVRFTDLNINFALQNFAIPTESEILHYDDGIKHRKEELEILTHFLRHGFGRRELDFFLQITDIENRTIILQKLAVYLDYFFTKKVLEFDRCLFSEIERLTNNPSACSHQFKDLQKWILIYQIIKLKRKEGSIRIQELSCANLTPTDKFKKSVLPDLKIKDIVLALYKPVRQIKNWSINNSKNHLRAKLEIENTLNDIFQFIVGQDINYEALLFPEKKDYNFKQIGKLLFKTTPSRYNVIFNSYIFEIKNIQYNLSPLNKSEFETSIILHPKLPFYSNN